MKLTKQRETGYEAAKQDRNPTHLHLALNLLTAKQSN